MMKWVAMVGGRRTIRVYADTEEEAKGEVSRLFLFCDLPEWHREWDKGGQVVIEEKEG